MARSLPYEAIFMSSDLPFLWEDGAASGWGLRGVVPPPAAPEAGSVAPQQEASSAAAEPWVVFRALLPAVFGAHWAVLPRGLRSRAVFRHGLRLLLDAAVTFFFLPFNTLVGFGGGGKTVRHPNPFVFKHPDHLAQGKRFYRLPGRRLRRSDLRTSERRFRLFPVTWPAPMTVNAFRSYG
jgi:hypothetical protein